MSRSEIEKVDPIQEGGKGLAVQPKIVTIWAHYSPNYLARLTALERRGCDVIGFSYCAFHEGYPFFGHAPRRHELINDCLFSEVRPLLSFRRTLRLLNRHRPHVVLSCGYERPEGAAALAYSRRARTDGVRPVVLLMMDNTADDHFRPRWKEVVKSAYLKLFDGFLVSGSRTRDYLGQLGVPVSRIRNGYGCVDNDGLRSLVATAKRQAPLVGGGGDYFLCVARFLARKNLLRLVRAYAEYRGSLPLEESPWRLVLVGDGPMREEVESLVAQKGLVGDVVLVGQVDELETLANYYAFARACILATETDEPWGLVVNEAMAAGLPVLVSNRCGCAADLVAEGLNGFTFDPYDEAELAGRMRWMHDHRERLEPMGRASWEIVQRFSPASFATSVLDLAEGIWGGRVSPRGVGEEDTNTEL
jgi:glycosyltransferase involved in cell wall biosynthesis